MRRSAGHETALYGKSRQGLCGSAGRYPQGVCKTTAVPACESSTSVTARQEIQRGHGCVAGQRDERLTVLLQDRGRRICHPLNHSAPKVVSAPTSDGTIPVKVESGFHLQAVEHARRTTKARFRSRTGPRLCVTTPAGEPPMPRSIHPKTCVERVRKPHRPATNDVTLADTHISRMVRLSSDERRQPAPVGRR